MQRPWLEHYPDGVPHTVEVPDEPLSAILERAGARWPDRVAVDFLGATVTYAGLLARVRQAAAALAGLGVRPGDRVAIAVPNSTSHVVAFHAVVLLGAVVVELNPTYTKDELSHLLADCDPTVVLAWRHIAGVVEEAARGTAVRHVVCVDIAKDLPTSARLLLHLPVKAAREKEAALGGDVPPGLAHWHTLLDAARKAGPQHAPGPSPATGDDIALLQYTGGTTGTPKAAILLHRNLSANVRQGQAWAAFAEGDEVVYGVLPFFHAFGMLFCLLLPAYVGATLVAFPNFDPAQVAATTRRRPATFLPGVAPMFPRICAAAEKKGPKAVTALRSVRLGFAGAMPISEEVTAQWERVTGGLLIEGYGMTECSPIALGNPCAPTRRPGTLGIPFPSTDIRVVDQEDPTRDAEPDEAGDRRGELLVRGPQVFTGYWNRPDETAAQLTDDGWLHTGDIVVADADGWVRLVDRVKEMIIVGGFKVYPSQVEDHLRTMPGVRDVAVIGIPAAGRHEEKVVAAVVLESPSTSLDLEAVRAWGEQRLPRYALPRGLVVVDELPRSQIGKVLRRVVRDQVLAEHAG